MNKAHINGTSSDVFHSNKTYSSFLLKKEINMELSLTANRVQKKLFLNVIFVLIYLEFG